MDLYNQPLKTHQPIQPTNQTLVIVYTTDLYNQPLTAGPRHDSPPQVRVQLRGEDAKLTLLTSRNKKRRGRVGAAFWPFLYIIGFTSIWP